jgi:hypothetical protein
VDRHYTEEAIGRLDTVCDMLHALAAKSVKAGWPQDLQLACQKLANDVESLAGALDRASDGQPAIHDLTTKAQESLPKDFASFGTALAADLAKLLLPKVRP